MVAFLALPRVLAPVGVLAAIARVLTLIPRDIDVLIPVVTDEINAAAAGVVLTTVLAPVPLVAHRHVQVQLDNLVVQATGHMRGTFAGRAYLPKAIPVGVSLGDLH